MTPNADEFRVRITKFLRTWANIWWAWKKQTLLNRLPKKSTNLKTFELDRMKCAILTYTGFLEGNVILEASITFIWWYVTCGRNRRDRTAKSENPSQMAILEKYYACFSYKSVTFDTVQLHMAKKYTMLLYTWRNQLWSVPPSKRIWIEYQMTS